MTTYNVIDKTTGLKYTSYTTDGTTPIEWVGMEFDKYDHIAEHIEPVLPPRMYPHTRQLTKLQWRKLLKKDENIAFDRIRATFEDDARFDSATRDNIRTFCNMYDEATLMDLDDPDQKVGLGLLYSLGVLATADRITEILNG